MTDQEPFEIVRVFIADGTYSDARLASWDAVIQGVITNGAFITDQVFISRSSITKIIRIKVVPDPDQQFPEFANVIDFPTPKGSA